MKLVDSSSFDLVKDYGYNNIHNLTTDYSLGVYGSPYKEIPVESFEDSKAKLTMFTTEDIAFVNTSEFTKTGQHFLKHGRYTNAHPLYDRTEYNAFWDEEERRCKEGLTLPGRLIKDEYGNYKMQEVHITGEHYGYLNYALIKRSTEFEEKAGGLYSPNGELLNKTTAGKPKEFSLPDFWDGDYYFFKAVDLCRQVGKHLVVGKARRKGYSYKNGWIVANRANLYRRSTSVVGAYDTASLFDDGTMVKVQGYLDHINKHTDWNKRRLSNTLEHIEIGYRYTGQPEKRGYLSNIYTAIFNGKPGAARGKDADLILIEEAGKCPNLSAVLDATLKSLTDGKYITGLLIVFGTGGGEDSQWQDFEDLFYEPFSRNFIMFQNVFDSNMEDTGCGYFHPCYMNKPGLIDQYGNSDIKGAIELNDYEKELVKHSPTKLNAHEMEEPERPSQAFSRATNSLFPAKELDEQLRNLLRNPDMQGLGREGTFINDGGQIKFIDKNLQHLYPHINIYENVTEYPLTAKTKDLNGCFVMFEAPYRDNNGNIPENLYTVWNDPFGISKEKEHFSLKDSLAVTYVYEATNNFTRTRGDRIVGILVGRTETTSEYDEQMFNIALYYNAKVFFENDRGDVFNNAKTRNLIHILKEEPEFQYQKDLQKGGKGRKKGISIASNSSRKTNGVIYLRNWLLQERGVDLTGKKLLNLHYIYDVGVLRELLKYDGKRNADRVSALIVGMFDIKESIFKEVVPEIHTYNEQTNSYFNNPFG